MLSQTYQILEPWTQDLKMSTLQLSNIVTALVKEHQQGSSSPPRTDTLIQYGLFMAAMWMRSSVAPINMVPSPSMSPPRTDVSLDSPDRVAVPPSKTEQQQNKRRRPKTAAARHRRSPLVSRLRCRAVYGGGGAKRIKTRKKGPRKRPETSSTSDSHKINKVPTTTTVNSPMRSDETVQRLRVLVREKQDAVRALRKIAAREENHVHMLKTWSKSSVENLSEIEKLLRRRKKTAAAGKKDSKKTSTRTYRNL